jgi:hypothetical protein
MTLFLWILFMVLVLAPSAALPKARHVDWRAVLLLLCVTTLLLHV